MLANARLYQRGAGAWFRGEESDEAVAGGENVVEVLALLRDVMAKKG